MAGTIGDVLKKLRTEKGYSMVYVAKQFDMSLGAYQKYENNTNDVSTSTLGAFADFYGVTTDYLLGRTDKKPDPVELLTSMEDEQKLVKAYFNLPPQLRANFLQSLLEELHRQEGTNITVTQNPEQAIARSSDGDFKPAPTEQQHKTFTECPENEIDG